MDVWRTFVTIANTKRVAAYLGPVQTECNFCNKGTFYQLFSAGI